MFPWVRRRPTPSAATRLHPPQIPAFICNDVEATAPCAEFASDEEPVPGSPGECSIYVRQIAFLTAVTFIASPSSSNGSYVRPPFLARRLPLDAPRLPNSPPPPRRDVACAELPLRPRPAPPTPLLAGLRPGAVQPRLHKLHEQPQCAPRAPMHDHLPTGARSEARRAQHGAPLNSRARLAGAPPAPAQSPRPPTRRSSRSSQTCSGAGTGRSTSRSPVFRWR